MHMVCLVCNLVYARGPGVDSFISSVKKDQGPMGV